MPSSSFNEKLDRFDSEKLFGLKIGLEKESLRVKENGRISDQAHPQALGSPLTHPYITTDYAEALLELITPPCESSAETLDFLATTEAFVYHHLNHEKLWTTSMPCALNGEDDIQIARYGSSNIGQMKTIYRRGLGHRYGKLMQVIAGVHFNFSFPEPFWRTLHQLDKNAEHLSLRNFKDQSYMDMIRNIQRYGWLVIYLFGASPAISKTFLKGMPGSLSKLDQDSYYEPYATSLRMGDIGYTNSKEGKSGIHIGYNSLAEYLATMRQAINCPSKEYARIGIRKNGRYQQLNTNILQIENEHYSTVRPKQILNTLEKPVDALEQRGIEYIELRSLDINPFCPTGLTLQQLHFLEVFMSFCLFKDSPTMSPDENKELNLNQLLVAHQGRQPGLELHRSGRLVLLKDLAKQIFEQLTAMAGKMDQTYACERYSQAVRAHYDMIENPDLTPSAQVLGEMREKQESFMAFTLRKSCQHRDFYLSHKMDSEKFRFYNQISRESLLQQQSIEEQEVIDFEKFMDAYQNPISKDSVGPYKNENIKNNESEQIYSEY